MMNERAASVLLILAFAALLAMLSLRKDKLLTMVNPSLGAKGGPTNFNIMGGSAGYMNYNWSPPSNMAYMLPQTSQGGSLSPLGFPVNPCGGQC